MEPGGGSMATVIKANETGSLLQRLSTVDLADHLAEARTVLEGARRRASQVISEAERQAALDVAAAKRSSREAGYTEGYEEGRRTGYRAAHAEATARFDREHADVTNMMHLSVAAMDAIKDELRIEAERDLLDFAVALASKLTFAIGRVHREAAVSNLRRALRQVGTKTDLTIRAHPDDAATIGAFAEGLAQRISDSPYIQMVPDDTIAPGGCKVEGDRTRVDATLETQIEEIVALLVPAGQGSNEADPVGDSDG